MYRNAPTNEPGWLICVVAGKVIARNWMTGKRVWERIFHTPSAVARACLIARDHVYVAGWLERTAVASCYEYASGRLVWQKEIVQRTSSVDSPISIALEGDLLAIACEDNMRTVDARTGVLVWEAANHEAALNSVGTLRYAPTLLGGQPTEREHT
jgi:outer membrane protein assembly factor BamB